jgi:hypothetical protein
MKTDAFYGANRYHALHLIGHYVTLRKRTEVRTAVEAVFWDGSVLWFSDVRSMYKGMRHQAIADGVKGWAAIPLFDSRDNVTSLLSVEFWDLIVSAEIIKNVASKLDFRRCVHETAQLRSGSATSTGLALFDTSAHTADYGYPIREAARVLNKVGNFGNAGELKLRADDWKTRFGISPQTLVARYAADSLLRMAARLEKEWDDDQRY